MFEKVSLHATPLTPNDLSLYLFQQKLQSFLYNGQVDLTLNVNLLHFLYYPNLKIVSLVNEFLPYVWLYFREYLLRHHCMLSHLVLRQYQLNLKLLKIFRSVEGSDEKDERLKAVDRV